MSTTAAQLPRTETPEQDQRVVFNGMSWWQFESILAVRGDKSVPRIAYMNGVIELLSPSRKHERTKSTLGMLIEAYCFHHGIYFDPIASTTLKNPVTDRGAEPDESYAFSKGKDVPDLVIEVIYTSGSIDKLALYRGLGVKEVWFWIEDQLLGYVLQEGQYVSIETSVVLPDIQLRQLASFAQQDDGFEAVQAFRKTLTKA